MLLWQGVGYHGVFKLHITNNRILSGVPKWFAIPPEKLNIKGEFLKCLD